MVRFKYCIVRHLFGDQKLLKNSFSRIVITLFLTLGLTLMLNIQCAMSSEPVAHSHDANAIWLEPSTVNLSGAQVGSRFNITAWVNLTVQSFAWQVKIPFNSTYFSGVRAGYTAGVTSNFFAGHTTVSVNPVMDNHIGYIMFGECLLGGSARREPGYGSLMWVEFELVEMPPQNCFTFNFSTPYGENTFILDPSLHLIPLGTVDEVDDTNSRPTIPPPTQGGCDDPVYYTSYVPEISIINPFWRAGYGDFLDDFNSLNLTYYTLLNNYNLLTSELHNVRNIMYVSIITAAIFATTTAIFTIRKPKTKQ